MAKPKAMGDAEYRALLDRSMEELRLKTGAHDAGWGLGAADWAVDQDTGLITFTGKKMVATAPAQIIATYNTQDGTWLWGWDHPSVADDMAEHARQVYEYGEQHGLTDLTTRKLECSEDEAWELTALACHLCGAQGAYRGPAGTAVVFLTFGKVTLSQPKGKRR
jgi:hypothetical protein